MNAFDQLTNAMRDAREIDLAVERQANAMVDLLEKHLQSVSKYRLQRLKRKLQNFNAATGRWK